MKMIKGNKRLEGETFSNYKKRLKQEAKRVKSYLKGRYVWLSSGIRDIRGNVQHRGQGTYIRKFHGRLPD